MIFPISKKLNFIFPLTLFNSEYFFLTDKFINIKYLYLQSYIYSFIKSVKYINTTYFITRKLLKRIKKSNVITRNNLSKSTKKPWKQKGLGKARAGSFKSPLWRGGSVLFGPISRKISVILQAKKKKISFFYVLLNKRTYISFVFLTPTVHTFNNIREHLNQQIRIRGIFSNKLVYVSLNNINKHVGTNIRLNFFVCINLLNIISFLKFDYIIFLI